MPTLMATTSASRGSSGASLVSRVFVLALLAILAALYHHHSASSALSSASLRDLKASLTACAAREATLSDQREAAREHAKGIQRKCDEDSKQKSNIAQGDVARCQGDLGPWGLPLHREVRKDKVVSLLSSSMPDL